MPRLVTESRIAVQRSSSGQRFCRCFPPVTLCLTVPYDIVQTQSSPTVAQTKQKEVPYMCNFRFRCCCCCPCCCRTSCRPGRPGPGGPGGVGPGGSGPGGVGPGNDICAGVRRRAYREGFHNGYWTGYNDALYGRGPGSDGPGRPGGPGGMGPGRPDGPGCSDGAGDGCCCSC